MQENRLRSSLTSNCENLGLTNMPENHEAGQFGLPASWSKDCSQKQVKVEMGVEPHVVGAAAGPGEIGLDRAWFEIPTTEVELWINKHGAADMNRIAKIKFPTEWDIDEEGEPVSVVGLISTFRPEEGENNITYCRISFREDDDDDWHVKHFGFVGGVGQSAKRGVSKMWVYDFAEMIDKIPATINFNRPTPEAVMETTMRIFNDRTPVRMMTRSHLIGPNGTVDDANFADTVLQTQDLLLVTTTGMVGTVPIRPDPKTFYSNRDTLGDVLDWLAEKLNAIWYFEPTPGGAVLIVDSAGRDGNLSRTEFSQPEGDISVIQNNATYEIDPVNTVVLRGSQDDSLSVKITDFFTRNNIQKRFPIAKVRAETLFEKNVIGSGSVDGGELVYLADGDATSIDGAIREAKDLLRELIEEEAEGVIKMRGHPDIEPYDVLESHFTCAEDFPEQVVPLHYEVEEAKHHAKAGKIYRTNAYVSIFLGEENIVVIEDETRMVDPDEEAIDA